MIFYWYWMLGEKVTKLITDVG